MASVVGEPPAKRKRVDDVADGKNGGMEDDATAKRKLAEAGFDPNDCITAIDPPRSKWPKVGSWKSITPMTYFCFYGDLPMCRYILSQGGSTTKAGGEFSMYAAIYKGNMEVVQWLFQNGAKEDTLSITVNGLSPWYLCWRGHHKELLFLVNGVFELDTITVANQLRKRNGTWEDHRPNVLSWSQDVLKMHGCFDTFLMGTFIGPEFSTQALYTKLEAKLGSTKAANIVIDGLGKEKCTSLWTELMEPYKKSPVRCFHENIGVLNCIAEFVHGFSAKEIEKIHQLTKLLHQSLKEHLHRRHRG
ncbi:expressed unknown protein [Seminavis robusta]|uniref:Uncharacterized protein n=1 Tax=Seminavis robusta TaxID=568900 RepID=A0A9N8H1U1_9STRA|nr:expressed unknown protein [Seminavis robusta]|eukprot:Sro23_g015800.1 n/a (303) ;mRNA; f:76209-77132